MQSPRICFATTCKDRTEHLKQTLPRNLAENADYPNAVFVVLGYGDRNGLADYMRSPEIAPHIESGRVVYYNYPDGEGFQMALAKNLAHRCGILEGADLLVNTDADNYLGQGFARWLAGRFSPNAFFWTAKTKGVPRGVSGRIAVTKRQFLCAGGYDEKFSTWSRDDKDFNQRLCRMGFDPIQIDRYFAQAIDHSDEERFFHYPRTAETWRTDRQIQANDESVTVVNWGKFGMGEVYRNFRYKPITLGPLPTRIFGIGMHKTATTSLDEAFKILGIDSAHWLSHDWAQLIWTSMKEFGRSLSLERHYALSDLPISLLYKQLDVAYPGSKFILTTRKEENWLRSIRDHLDPNLHKAWKYWGQHPFPDAIHKALYGRTGFDRETMLARYREHNREVLKYFANRFNDLLVLDMDNGHGWAELCGFLGAPIPNQPYPTLNPKPVLRKEAK
jgi:Sulfotransferase domain/N-terminal domain of galactosyltransferase